MSAGPRILVLGRAKSGTTFVHAALRDAMKAAAPGDPPHSWFEPSAPRAVARLARKAGERPIAAKILHDHWENEPLYWDSFWGEGAPARFARTVALIRDPRDELISRLLYMPYARLWSGEAAPADIERWAAAWRAKEADPAAMGLGALLDEFGAVFGGKRQGLLRWHAQRAAAYGAFLTERGGDFLILPYERAVDGAWALVSDYVGFPVRGEGALGSQAHTKRTGSYGAWRHVARAEDLDMLREALGEVCARWGYDDWSLADRPRLEPAHYSLYLERLAATFRAKQGPLRLTLGRWRAALRQRLGRG